jgi:hypothetical protein
MTKEKKEKLLINPIDADKVAENPHLLPYAHQVGSLRIDPVDKGKIKGQAMAAMYEQSDRQLDQIREQVELLVKQAKAIQDRVRVSESIYQAEINFEPVINKVYHLYRRDAGRQVLSLVAPGEWGRRQPYTFIATVRLLSDHTWEIVEKNTEEI